MVNDYRSYSTKELIELVEREVNNYLHVNVLGAVLELLKRLRKLEDTDD